MTEQRSYRAWHCQQEYLPKQLAIDGEQSEDFTDYVENFSNSILIDLQYYVKPGSMVREHDNMLSNSSMVDMFSTKDFSNLSARLLREVHLPITWTIILSAHQSLINVISTEVVENNVPVVVLQPFQYTLKTSQNELPDQALTEYEIINQIDLHWEGSCCIYT